MPARGPGSGSGTSWTERTSDGSPKLGWTSARMGVPSVDGAATASQTGGPTGGHGSLLDVSRGTLVPCPRSPRCASPAAERSSGARSGRTTGTRCATARAPVASAASRMSTSSWRRRSPSCSTSARPTATICPSDAARLVSGDGRHRVAPPHGARATCSPSPRQPRRGGDHAGGKRGRPVHRQGPDPDPPSLTSYVTSPGAGRAGDRLARPPVRPRAGRRSPDL